MRFIPCSPICSYFSKRWNTPPSSSSLTSFSLFNLLNFPVAVLLLCCAISCVALSDQHCVSASYRHTIYEVFRMQLHYSNTRTRWCLSGDIRLNREIGQTSSIERMSKTSHFSSSPLGHLETVVLPGSRVFAVLRAAPILTSDILIQTSFGAQRLLNL